MTRVGQLQEFPTMNIFSFYTIWHTLSSNLGSPVHDFFYKLQYSHSLMETL